MRMHPGLLIRPLFPSHAASSHSLCLAVPSKLLGSLTDFATQQNLPLCAATMNPASASTPASSATPAAADLESRLHNTLSYYNKLAKSLDVNATPPANVAPREVEAAKMLNYCVRMLHADGWVSRAHAKSFW